MLPRTPRAGDDIFLAGFRPDLEPVIRSYEAGDLKLINLAPSNFGGFREANLEILEVENADVQISGVLLDSRSRVVALWSSFASGSRNRPNEVVAGLPIEHVQAMLDHLRREAPLAFPGGRVATRAAVGWPCAADCRRTGG